MAGEEDWRVSDLLDDKHQPFVEDVVLARQMLSTLKELKSINKEGGIQDGFSSSVSIDVRTPRAAYEFIENTLSEWFETIAEIEKKRGNLPYLIDRSLYQDGSIEWNQGLTKNNIDSWLENSTYGIGHYSFMKPMNASDEPLSGYFNRLLPVKYVMRMLAVLTLNSDSFNPEDGWDETEDNTVTLTKLREKSWQTASYAKDSLILLDKFLNSDTGASLSVGFPGGETLEKIKKSKERFVSQFVGSNRKNKLSGAIFEMGFANMRKFLGRTTGEVWFTPEGWKFALLENPVIDQVNGWKSGNRFSDKEVLCLLANFQINVPAEWNFMLSIAGMIREGVDDTIGMNSALIRDNGWNRSKASVYRTGVIARMQELGLVDRVKNGVDVKFILTESGEKLLK